jgi:hypothetical protein
MIGDQSIRSTGTLCFQAGARWRLDTCGRPQCPCFYVLDKNYVVIISLPLITSCVLARGNHKNRRRTNNEGAGSFKGAIRISLYAPLFLFNDSTFLVVPRKSLNVHSSLFSIATDPTNDLPHCSQLSKIAGLEVRPMIRGVRESSGTRGMVGQFLHLAILRRAGNLEVCKGGAY